VTAAILKDEERGRSSRAGRPPWIGCPDIEVLVPVHDEARALEASIRRLYGFLISRFPFTWSIVIVDHASTDRTFATGLRLSYELRGVELMRLREPGRGRAIRRAWSQSKARVLCAMDVEVQADPWPLLPLVLPLLSEHDDVAVGTNAECPWMAIRADVARELMPLVRAQDRSFETELLMLALGRAAEPLTLVSPGQTMLAL
jgi:Glycosyl transferase family 2